VLKLSDSPVAFIGYDMGGAVATGFAAKFPNYCLSLTLISPLGIKFKSSLNEKVMQRKYSGIYYMSKQKKILEDLQESDFHDADMLSSHRYLIDKQKLMIKWQIKYTNGYLASLLSTYRYFPVRNMEELFTSIGRHPRKTLVIWGIQDKVCNYKKCIRAIEEDFPHGTVLDVADCGHNCVFEKFEDVAREILSFHEEVFEDDENYDDVAV
jgi:pimeloyl-ACP methyl ester carboxylesterase